MDVALLWWCDICVKPGPSDLNITCIFIVQNYCLCFKEIIFEFCYMNLYNRKWVILYNESAMPYILEIDTTKRNPPTATEHESKLWGFDPDSMGLISLCNWKTIIILPQVKR